MARRSHARAVAGGAALVLLVAVPTLVVEEQWHGLPMIDQGNSLWILPTALAACAFLAGGALAGAASPGAPTRRGGAVGAIAAAVLVGAAVARRYLLASKGISGEIVLMWAVAAAGSVALSMIGAHLGERFPRSASVAGRRRPPTL